MWTRIKKWLIKQGKDLLEIAVNKGEEALIDECLDYYVARTGISKEKRETIEDFLEYYTNRAEKEVVPRILDYLDEM